MFGDVNYGLILFMLKLFCDDDIRKYLFVKIVLKRSCFWK